jgi:hypothetical protein
MPAGDGTRRLVLIFAMPGTTVAVPLSGEQWDALAAIVAESRPTLDIVLAAPSPMEQTEDGGFRLGS